MSAVECFWSFGLLGAILIALLSIKRVRRRTSDFRESAAFKERLPNWVKQFEALAFCAFACTIVIGVAWLFYRVAGVVHEGRHATTGAAAVYFTIGAFLISIPVSGLAANLLSWLLLPVRAANARAMAGLQVSFWSMNRGLLYFGAVSVPLGLAILFLAASKPWSR